MLGNLLAGIGRIGSMLGNPPPPNGERTWSPGQDLYIAIWNITWPILLVVASLGGIFAIWVGVRLATAQDESKRKEAKAQLIWAIIAIVIVAAIIGIMGVVRTTLTPVAIG